MSRLTAGERRRANDLRRLRVRMRAPRVVTVEHLETREAGWDEERE